jgi:hypothetical protein
MLDNIVLVFVAAAGIVICLVLFLSSQDKSKPTKAVEKKKQPEKKPKKAAAEQPKKQEQQPKEEKAEKPTKPQKEAPKQQEKPQAPAKQQPAAATKQAEKPKQGTEQKAKQADKPQGKQAAAAQPAAKKEAAKAPAQSPKEPGKKKEKPQKDDAEEMEADVDPIALHQYQEGGKGVKLGGGKQNQEAPALPKPTTRERNKLEQQGFVMVEKRARVASGARDPSAYEPDILDKLNFGGARRRGPSKKEQEEREAAMKKPAGGKIKQLATFGRSDNTPWTASGAEGFPESSGDVYDMGMDS